MELGAQLRRWSWTSWPRRARCLRRKARSSRRRGRPRPPARTQARLSRVAGNISPRTSLERAAVRRRGVEGQARHQRRPSRVGARPQMPPARWRRPGGIAISAEPFGARPAPEPPPGDRGCRRGRAQVRRPDPGRGAVATRGSRRSTRRAHPPVAADGARAAWTLSWRASCSSAGSLGLRRRAPHPSKRPAPAPGRPLLPDGRHDPQPPASTPRWLSSAAPGPRGVAVRHPTFAAGTSGVALNWVCRPTATGSFTTSSPLGPEAGLRGLTYLWNTVAVGGDSISPCSAEADHRAGNLIDANGPGPPSRAAVNPDAALLVFVLGGGRYHHIEAKIVAASNSPTAALHHRPRLRRGLRSISKTRGWVDRRRQDRAMFGA